MEWIYGILADITETAASIFGAPEPRPDPRIAEVPLVQMRGARKATSMEEKEDRIRREIHVRTGRIEVVQKELAAQQEEYTATLRRLCLPNVSTVEKTSLTAKANILKKRVAMKRGLLDQLSQHIVVLENTLVTMEAGLANLTMQESVVGASTVLGTKEESDAVRSSFDTAADTINERASEDVVSTVDAVRAMFPDEGLDEDSLENDIAEMRAMLEGVPDAEAEPSAQPALPVFPSVPQTVRRPEPVNATRAAADTRALLRRFQ